MKRYLLLITFVVFVQALQAQDPHFSQFFASPLTLNPAYTGRFDGDIRAAGNYRNQWPTINRAFTTYTLSVDAPILKGSIPDIDRLAIGGLALVDQQADGVLKNSYFTLSLGYTKSLDQDGNHSVSVGFQGTYAQKRLNTLNLKFEDQLRSDGFTGITAEIFDPQQMNINYFDLNTGLMFTGAFANDMNYYVGGSLYHITRPRESFRGADFTLNHRYSVHGGTWQPINDQVVLHTSALWQYQGGAQELILGGAAGINANTGAYNPATFYAGAFWRVKDALIPYIGLEWSTWRLGLSYDVNISSLKGASNSRGGFELSLIYTGKRYPNARGVACPKF